MVYAAGIDFATTVVATFFCLAAAFACLALVASASVSSCEADSTLPSKTISTISFTSRDIEFVTLSSILRILLAAISHGYRFPCGRARAARERRLSSHGTIDRLNSSPHLLLSVIQQLTGPEGATIVMRR